MSEVILVRPGHTEFDEQNRIQGLLDLPLSERGLQHIDDVVRQLGSLDVDVILTDPGEPARTTAEAIGQALDVPVKEHADFRNLDQGLWQGLQLDEIRRKYPKLLRQWHEHPETICPPQGEPVCEAIGRIRDALKKPMRKYKRFVIVAADPLATLIAGIVRGTKPEFTGPMCSHSGRCVEPIGDGPSDGAVNGTVQGATVHGATNNGGMNGRLAVGPNGSIPIPAASLPALPETNGHEFGH